MFQDDDHLFTIRGFEPHHPDLVESTISLIESCVSGNHELLETYITTLGKLGAKISSKFSPPSLNIFCPLQIQVPLLATNASMNLPIFIPIPHIINSPNSIYLKPLPNALSSISGVTIGLFGYIKWLQMLTNGRFAFQRTGGISAILQAASESYQQSDNRKNATDSSSLNIELENWLLHGLPESWDLAWQQIQPPLTDFMKERLGDSPHLLLATMAHFLLNELITEYILSQQNLCFRCDEFRQTIESLDLHHQNSLPLDDLATLFKPWDLLWHQSLPTLLPLAQQHPFSSHFDPVLLLGSLAKTSRQHAEKQLHLKALEVFARVDKAAGKITPTPSRVCLSLVKSQNWRDLLVFVCKDPRGLDHVVAALQGLEQTLTEHYGPQNTSPLTADS